MTKPYTYETTFREDQDIKIQFEVAPAEPDVGISRPYVSWMTVSDLETGKLIEVTEDEYEDLAVSCIEDANDTDDYHRSEAADSRRDRDYECRI